MQYASRRKPRDPFPSSCMLQDVEPTIVVLTFTNRCPRGVICPMYAARIGYYEVCAELLEYSMGFLKRGPAGTIQMRSQDIR